MKSLSESRLVFLDVETTGLSPACGDRIIELGLIICQGETEKRRASYLVNPGRSIPRRAHQVHGIGNQDVAKSPSFKKIAGEVATSIADSWVVGHNVRFDTGFLALELQLAGYAATPIGCLDTCQLATALWDFPNYRLETVVSRLGLTTTRFHRALDDANVTRHVFHAAVSDLGGWETLTTKELMRLHRYEPSWPGHSSTDLPKQLYDALTSGKSLSICYTNAEGQSSTRVIRPETSFASGRHTYVRAFCEQNQELRTFRLDRISLSEVNAESESTLAKGIRPHGDRN